jgi:hypothetical protein
MRRWAAFGTGLAVALLLSATGRATALEWADELPSSSAVRRAVSGADARARLEAAFATLCDYVETRNAPSKILPARARALSVEYGCRQRRSRPISIEASRLFQSAAFRRELLTTFISPASFEIYAARSETMRNQRPRSDRE